MKVRAPGSGLDWVDSIGPILDTRLHFLKFALRSLLDLDYDIVSEYTQKANTVGTAVNLVCTPHFSNIAHSTRILKYKIALETTEPRLLVASCLQRSAKSSKAVVTKDEVPRPPY